MCIMDEVKDIVAFYICLFGIVVGTGLIMVPLIMLPTYPYADFKGVIYSVSCIFLGVLIDAFCLYLARWMDNK